MPGQSKSKRSRDREPKPIAASAENKPSRSVVPRLLRWVPCALGLLIYTPALKFDFIYDDHEQIVQNVQAQSWSYFPQIFTTTLWSPSKGFTIFYRPIFALWLLVVHAVGGLSPWFWHLSSAVLHAIATYFVFELCLKMLESPAAAGFAALLFAVYPIHNEAVCWISASNEILYTLFVLGSLLLFIQGLRTSVGAGFRMSLSAAAWAAALFSKETAIVVLPLFFFLAYKSANNSVEQRARLWQAFRRGAPFLIVALLYLAARLMAAERIGLEKGRLSWHQVLYTSPSLFVFYIRKLLWPAGLSGFYVNPLVSAPTRVMWFTVVLILAGVLAFAWISMRREPVVGLAGGLVILPLLPVLIGMRVFREGDWAHDRYLYLPSVGVCLLIGLLTKSLWGRSPRTRLACGAAGSCLFLLFVWFNLTQQSFHQDDVSFYERGLEINPRNVHVMDLLGDFYASRQQFDLALEQYKRAHDIEPDNPIVTVYLARGLFASQQYSAAEPYLEQLSHDKRLKPEQRLDEMVALGQVEIELGRLPAAEAVLNQVQRENESCPVLHFMLGVLYQRQGKIPEAQREYAREYDVSGNLIARQRAMELARLMRSSAAHSPATGSSDSMPKN
jgi:protein O-mannosyl-transferase